MATAEPPKAKAPKDKPTPCPIVPNGRGRCLACGKPSNGNAYCPEC